MERNIIQQLAAQIYKTDEVPDKILQEANALYLQSRASLPLKPNQEPARIHLCCVLAGEKGAADALPRPDTSRPPIPPAQYTRLLQQFRSALLPPATPSRRKRRTRADFSQYVDDDEGGGYKDDDDDEFDGKAALAGEEPDVYDNDEPDFDAEEELSTPRRQPPARSSRGSPSPRKAASPRKPAARIPPPTRLRIEALAERAGLHEQTVETVLHGLELYQDLVKDKWGLVYGLLVVVAGRVEPQAGPETERRLARAFDVAAPGAGVDKDEWRSWCARIVTNQTWISSVARVPERPLDLIGSPGGWGLGVEFNLLGA